MIRLATSCVAGSVRSTSFSSRKASSKALTRIAMSSGPNDCPFSSSRIGTANPNHVLSALCEALDSFLPLMWLATADGQNGLHGPSASERSARGKPDGGVLSDNVRPRGPAPRAPVYISRWRARMTVLADHGAPLGVSTWRAFNSAATARADMPVNSERIGAMARARSKGVRLARFVDCGQSRAAELDASRLGRRKAGLGAVSIDPIADVRPPVGG
jgi:hypothetical protein